MVISSQPRRPRLATERPRCAAPELPEANFISNPLRQIWRSFGPKTGPNTPGLMHEQPWLRSASVA